MPPAFSLASRNFPGKTARPRREGGIIIVGIGNFFGRGRISKTHCFKRGKILGYSQFQKMYQKENSYNIKGAAFYAI